jgi:hypothetical protein
MHSAIDDPSVISRTFVRAIFDYPFVQLGFTSLFAMVDSENHQALDIDKRVGFKEVNRFKDAGAEGDMILLHLHRDDCKWLRGIDGKQTTPTGTRLHRSSRAHCGVQRTDHKPADLRQSPHGGDAMGHAVVGDCGRS